MVKFQPSFLVDKYNNSIDHWLLPIPVMDNGELKLRCCMSRKQKGVFTDIYTYNIDKCRDVLLLFFTEQSYGQAYHKFIRLMKDRDSFINETNHEKGLFIMEDIKNIMFIGKTAYICSVIEKHIKDKDNNFDFSWKGIKPNQRKTVAKLKKEAVEQEKRLKDMGYDY